jgi:hypothetical protein
VCWVLRHRICCYVAIRELARLSRLAAAHSVDEFRDPTSTAHRELVEIVHGLAW